MSDDDAGSSEMQLKQSPSSERAPSKGVDLPPSCRYVLYVLESEGELARQELLEYTGLPEQTVDWALETLTDAGYLLKSRDPMDLRQVVYEVSERRRRDD